MRKCVDVTRLPVVYNATDITSDKLRGYMETNSYFQGVELLNGCNTHVMHHCFLYLSFEGVAASASTVRRTGEADVLYITCDNMDRIIVLQHLERKVILFSVIDVTNTQ